MSISMKQNTPESQRLLVAQRHLYSQAKRWHLVRLLGAIALEAAAPLVLLAAPGVKHALEVAGGVAVLVSHLVCQRKEQDDREKAATIQEQFDTSVFDLAWNPVLVPDKVDPEVLLAAARDFRGLHAGVRDWYGDTSAVPHPVDVLLCQRANLVWDAQLRRRYARILRAVVLAVPAAEIVVGLATGQLLSEYFLALLLPSLPALLEGFDIARENEEHAARKEALKAQLQGLWEGALRGESVTVEQCRRIQDAIYTLRSTGPLVLDRLYHRFRRRDEGTMRAAVEELVAAYRHSVVPAGP